MVVRNIHCSRDSCSRVACFKMEGCKRAVYCSQHAEKNMVDVRSNRCRHPVCTRQASNNVEGKKTGVYCKEHAESWMANVRTNTKVYISRCSHDACRRKPSWGAPTKGAPTVCARHKNDLRGGLVFNFRVSCKVVGCSKASRWGLDGKQPTHCPEHSHLGDGLVCTLMTAGAKSGPSRSPYGAIKGSSCRVKTERLL